MRVSFGQLAIALHLDILDISYTVLLAPVSGISVGLACIILIYKFVTQTILNAICMCLVPTCCFLAIWSNYPS